MTETEICEALRGKTIFDVEFGDRTIFVWLDREKGFFVSASDGLYIGEVQQQHAGLQ